MRSIGQFLQRRATQRLWARAREMDRLLTAVRRALPEPLGQHCVGALRQDRHLTLFADSPLWATRLRYAGPSLLEGLGAPARGLREVRVRVALPQGGVPRITPGPRPLSEEVARLIEETAAGLPDKELGEALGRLVRRAAARRREGSR